MYARCLVCNTTFERNEELEFFPHGRRVAYDPNRGRLWTVCRACRRWSLAPIEERWEALDELEKAVRDRGRVLSSTDNVALIRVGHLEVVRVGPANRAEEAWWRYGNELVRQRQSYRKLALVGTLTTGAVIAGGWVTGGISWLGAWMLWEHLPDGVTRFGRWLRFGGTAWRGERACAKCGYVFRRLEFSERRRVILAAAQDEGAAVEVRAPCPVCGTWHEGGLALRGEAGEATARRLLAYQHFAGASERRVRSAARLIE
ncbi:MAG: hypothetical protein D6701_13410, partial [Gemmatimonadetes bacterium]